MVGLESTVELVLDLVTPDHGVISLSIERLHTPLVFGKQFVKRGHGPDDNSAPPHVDSSHPTVCSPLSLAKHRAQLVHLERHLEDGDGPVPCTDSEERIHYFKLRYSVEPSARIVDHVVRLGGAVNKFTFHRPRHACPCVSRPGQGIV
jgi:hypothetical protein